MAAGNIWVRIAATDDTRIDVHKLQGAMALRATSKITDQKFIDTFGLDADGQLDFTALKAAYTAVSGAAGKVEWLVLTFSVFELLQKGDITEAQAKNFLGII